MGRGVVHVVNVEVAALTSGARARTASRARATALGTLSGPVPRPPVLPIGITRRLRIGRRELALRLAASPTCCGATVDTLGWCSRAQSWAVVCIVDVRLGATSRARGEGHCAPNAGALLPSYCIIVGTSEGRVATRLRLLADRSWRDGWCTGLSAARGVRDTQLAECLGCDFCVLTLDIGICC